jgi:hypothetical protein
VDKALSCCCRSRWEAPSSEEGAALGRGASRGELGGDGDALPPCTATKVMSIR